MFRIMSGEQIMSGDQGSPTTSMVRAIEHAIAPKAVRCMNNFTAEGSLRERIVLTWTCRFPKGIHME